MGVAHPESLTVSPGDEGLHNPAPCIARRGARGVPAGSAVAVTVRTETGRTRENALRMACGWCSRRTGGDGPGMVPGVPSRVAYGRTGWMHPRCGPAGRCTSRTPSQPLRSGAETRREKEVPFPAECELPLPANLRNVFPRRTLIAQGSAVEAHSRP